MVEAEINETACICLPCVKQIQRNQDIIVWEISENIANLRHLSTFFWLAANAKLLPPAFAHVGKMREVVAQAVHATSVRTTQRHKGDMHE